jgi:hypothetical protein
MRDEDIQNGIIRTREGFGRRDAGVEKAVIQSIKGGGSNLKLISRSAGGGK